jgi:hypothetical protein
MFITLIVAWTQGDVQKLRMAAPSTLMAALEEE